jgi:hypothetical protein
MNPAPIKAQSSSPAWLRPVIVALAAFLLLACFSTEVADADTWFHLYTGKYLVEQHKLPLPDPFAFTTDSGTPLPGEETVRAFNVTHEWLAQSILYLSYAAGGFGGMVLLRAFLMTTFCGLVGLWTWRRSGGFYRALGAAFVTAFIASYFTSDRPFHITYVLIMVTILILESRRWLWVLPPLFLFWANCHGGFFMGFVVLGAYCAESLWKRFRGKPEPDERRLWLVTAVCVPFAYLNPNGFRTLYILLAYKQSTLTRSLYEWQRPPLWPPSFLNLLLLAAAAVLVWRRKQTRVSDWLLLALFGAAYLQAIRNSPLLALVAPMIIATYFPWKRIAASWSDWAVAALLLCAIAVPFARGRAFQLRYAAWKYPAGAAEFLLAHHISGPMFNTFEKGAYLVWRCWPEQRDFIDGRGLNESVFADYERMIKYLAGTRELLDRYGIQVVVMNAFEANAGTPYVLPLALADPSEKEWKMVFADSGATIFMRNPPPGVQPLPSSQIFSSMEDQCQAIVDHDPGRPRCARSMAHLFTRLGDAGRARRWEDLYRSLAGSEP